MHLVQHYQLLKAQRYRARPGNYPELLEFLEHLEPEARTWRSSDCYQASSAFQSLESAMVAIELVFYLFSASEIILHAADFCC